jgi:hypothetical protein
MQSSISCVATRSVAAIALVIILGCGCSYADKAKSKPAMAKVSWASSQPVKLRYYGGPKSPMYP